MSRFSRILRLRFSGDAGDGGEPVRGAGGRSRDHVVLSAVQLLIVAWNQAGNSRRSNPGRTSGALSPGQARALGHDLRGPIAQSAGIGIEAGVWNAVTWHGHLSRSCQPNPAGIAQKRRFCSHRSAAIRQNKRA